MKFAGVARFCRKRVKDTAKTMNSKRLPALSALAEKCHFSPVPAPGELFVGNAVKIYKHQQKSGGVNMRGKSFSGKGFWMVLSLILAVALAVQAYRHYHARARIQTSRQPERILVSVPGYRNPVGVNAGQIAQSSSPQQVPTMALPRLASPQSGQPVRVNPYQQGTVSLNQVNPGSSTVRQSADPVDQMHQRMQAMMRRMMSNSGMGMRSGMMPRGMSSGFGRTGMGPDIAVEGNNYVVKLQMPGLDNSAIKTEVKGNMLMVSGTRKDKMSSQNGSGWGSSYRRFQTSFSLPGPVKSDQMKVDYSNDILTIKLPKA